MNGPDSDLSTTVPTIQYMKFVTNARKINETKIKSKYSATIVVIVALLMPGLAVSFMGASAVQVKAKEWLRGGGTEEAAEMAAEPNILESYTYQTKEIDF